MTLRSGALRTLLLLLPALPAAGDPAAWRLEGRGGGEVVLLGSVHTLRDSDHPLPASIDALYDDADTLVMELDMDDLNPAEIQGALLSAAMLTDGATLSNVLDARLYRDAEAHAQAFGIDLALLDRFEPWLVAITMTELGMTRLGFRSDRGIEQYLLGRSSGDGKEVLGLESLATQVAVFDDLSLDDQSALLEQTLAELDHAADVMDEMIAAWRTGELEALAASLLEDFDAFPDLYDSLIVARNRAWTLRIERLLESGSDYLIVVGALHLVGEDSVIDMLSERGHPAERVTH